MVLPGGLGTYEEFFEVLVGRVLDEHRKPIGIVNDHGYFDPLLAMIEHGINEKFIRAAVRKLMAIDTDSIRVLEQLMAFEPVELDAGELIPPLSGNGDSQQ